MPRTKKYSQREMLIDKCLSTGKALTGEALMRKINAELRSRGMPEILSRSTFAADINEINSKFYGVYHRNVIKRERHGRQYLYYYTVPGFSIYNRELTAEELNDIHHLVSTIRRFRGMPRFSWLETLEERFDQVALKTEKTVVAFDDAYNEDAMRPFADLLEAIEQKTVVDIGYCRFCDTTTTHYVVSPYFLKQYGLRWYLLASFKDNTNIYTFALDRVKSVAPLPDEEYEPSETDFEHYYDDVVGVSHDGHDVEHVRIWVSHDQLPYLLTKPLHKTQKVESEDEHGAMLSIDVVPNIELEQTILSQGATLEVMEPVWLRMKLKATVRHLLELYNTPEPGL